MVEPDRPITEVTNAAGVVRDEHEGPVLISELDELLHALLLKGDLADGEDLVDQEELRVDVDRDRKRQPDVHPRRIRFDRCVDELGQA